MPVGEILTGKVEKWDGEALARVDAVCRRTILFEMFWMRSVMNW